MEEIFDLRGFVLRLLLKWKMIFLTILIVGALGMLYGSITGFQAYQKENAKTLALYQDEFNLFQNQQDVLVREIASIESNYKQVEENSKNNFSTRLDAKQAYYAGAVLAILEENIDTRDSVFGIYSSYLSSNSILQELSQKKELLNEEQLRNIVRVSATPESKIITIRILGDNTYKPEEYREIILELINTKYKDLERTLMPHQLVVVTTFEEPNGDVYINEMQATWEKQKQAYSAEINLKKEALISMKQPTMPSGSSTRAFSRGIKFGLLFAALSFCGFIFVFFVMDIFDDRAKNKIMLSKRYNSPILLSLILKDTKRGFVDRFIYSLVQNGSASLSLEKGLPVLQSNLKLFGINSTVGIVGVGREDCVAKICELDSQSTDAVDFVNCSDIFSTATYINQLEKLQNVIIVIDIKTTTYSIIEEIKLRLDLADKKLIGFIVIE